MQPIQPSPREESPVDKARMGLTDSRLQLILEGGSDLLFDGRGAFRPFRAFKPISPIQELGPEQETTEVVRPVARSPQSATAQQQSLGWNLRSFSNLLREQPALRVLMLVGAVSAVAAGMAYSMKNTNKP